MGAEDGSRGSAYITRYVHERPVYNFAHFAVGRVGLVIHVRQFQVSKAQWWIEMASCTLRIRFYLRDPNRNSSHVGVQHGNSTVT